MPVLYYAFPVITYAYYLLPIPMEWVGGGGGWVGERVLCVFLSLPLLLFSMYMSVMCLLLYTYMKYALLYMETW